MSYVQTLAVPAMRNVEDPQVREGAQLFAQAGCVACHAPRHVTGTAHSVGPLREQVVFPYTDLLLHDMGEGLADGRPDGLASGSEWRTPPLWGIGLVETVSGHTMFLHDGRARSLEEAILWHGGEGQTSRNPHPVLGVAVIAACLRALLISGAILATVAACGSDAPDETETLISITDEVIVPHYEAAVGEMAELSAALAGLCAAPSDAALGAAREAWRSARTAWSRSEASGVGPVQDRRSTGLIAWPVVESERIDALLADNASVTADVVRNEISSTQRGLGAVEYLLFGRRRDRRSQQTTRGAPTSPSWAR